MIGYVTLGTNDLDRSVRYYDELLTVIEAQRFMQEEGLFVAWAINADPSTPSLAVTKPCDGKPASVGNGVMVALQMKTPKQVDEFYSKALELGGTDEGLPGPRGDGQYMQPISAILMAIN